MLIITDNVVPQKRSRLVIWLKVDQSYTTDGAHMRLRSMFSFVDKYVPLNQANEVRCMDDT